jgi:hypothetical protein
MMLRAKLLLGRAPIERSGEAHAAIAVRTGILSVVKLLLEKGADASSGFPMGRARGAAVNSMDPQVLQLLLDRGH